MSVLRSRFSRAHSEWSWAALYAHHSPPPPPLIKVVFNVYNFEVQLSIMVAKRERERKREEKHHESELQEQGVEGGGDGEESGELLSSPSVMSAN